jgi:hypothetical protein
MFRLEIDTGSVEIFQDDTTRRRGGFGRKVESFVYDLLRRDGCLRWAPPVQPVTHSFGMFDFSALTSQFHASSVSDAMLVRAVRTATALLVSSSMTSTVTATATDPAVLRPDRP